MCNLKLAPELVRLGCSWEDKCNSFPNSSIATCYHVLCALKTRSDADSKQFVRKYILMLQNSSRI